MVSFNWRERFDLGDLLFAQGEFAADSCDQVIRGGAARVDIDLPFGQVFRELLVGIGRKFSWCCATRR
ncbi:hypothetical protein BK669_04285 [Pseudomonas fluorescens]|nr:hypothetical protein BK669_04285 [Pseudomonas fluorescens]